MQFGLNIDFYYNNNNNNARKHVGSKALYFEVWIKGDTFSYSGVCDPLYVVAITSVYNSCSTRASIQTPFIYSFIQTGLDILSQLVFFYSFHAQPVSQFMVCYSTCVSVGP